MYKESQGTKRTKNTVMVPDNECAAYLNGVKIYGGWEDDEDRNLEHAIYERLCEALEMNGCKPVTIKEH